MGDENVLSAGINELYSMKQTLTELEGLKAKNTELTAREEQLEKEINVKEKQLADKIAAVTKTRRTELEAAYNEQVEKTKSRMRKVRSKKEKMKSSKISERIEAETSELAEEQKQYREEIKEIYKSNKIPKFLNNTYVHALYLPQGIRDILIILLTLAITLFAIPCGIYYFLLPVKTVYLVVTYIITVLLFGGLYMLIYRKTKERYPDAFLQIRNLRRNIAEKRRQIRAMERGIRKDKDESSYGLDKFNQELAELDEDICRISEEKKKALKKFENETKKVIADELTAESAKELNLLRNEHEKAYEEQRRTEEKIKTLTVTITDRYNTYIGKENMDIAMLDQLTRIMEAGEAATIGEALSIYRTEKSAASGVQKN